MFGMIIPNHMNMLGNNICVKLRLFNQKIKDIEKIKFTIFNDDQKLLETVEIDNIYEEDEYSSHFVDFGGLDKNKKYRIVAECCIEEEWVESANCTISTSTHNYSSGVSVYRTTKEEGLPISGVEFNETNVKIPKPSVLSVEYEVK